MIITDATYLYFCSCFPLFLGVKFLIKESCLCKRNDKFIWYKNSPHDRGLKIIAILSSWLTFLQKAWSLLQLCLVSPAIFRLNNTPSVKEESCNASTNFLSSSLLQPAKKRQELINFLWLKPTSTLSWIKLPNRNNLVEGNSCYDPALITETFCGKCSWCQHCTTSWRQILPTDFPFLGRDVWEMWGKIWWERGEERWKPKMLAREKERGGDLGWPARLYHFLALLRRK